MYVLYYSPFSQHARRVVSLLEEVGLRYEGKLIEMGQGEFRSPEYLAINPNGQIPTLLDRDIKIHESNAILRYLCSKHSLTQWYPEELKARAAVEQWLDWGQCRLSAPVVDVVLNKVFLGEQGDKIAIERGHHQLAERLPILDAALQEQPFLAGERPSIADLSMASMIFHLGLAQAMPQQANIQLWFGKISELRGFRASLPPKPGT